MTVLKREERNKTSPYVSQSTMPMTVLKREEHNKTSPYVSTHMTVLKRKERHKTSPYVSQSTTPMTVLKREEHNKTSPCVFSSRNANNCTKKRRISLVTKCYSKFLKATHFDLASSYTKQITKRSFSKSSFWFTAASAAKLLLLLMLLLSCCWCSVELPRRQVEEKRKEGGRRFGFGCRERRASDSSMRHFASDLQIVSISLCCA